MNLKESLYGLSEKKWHYLKNWQLQQQQKMMQSHPYSPIITYICTHEMAIFTKFHKDSIFLRPCAVFYY